MQTRRNFFQTSVAIALPPATGKATSSALLPTIPLGNHHVTRLVVGSNPFYGYSHFNKILSQHMEEWATQENVCRTIKRCEECGINTWQFSHNDRSVSDIQRHKADGGRLQWILTTSGKMLEDRALTVKLAGMKPIAIVHQGVSTDKRWAAGEQNKIREFLKWVRDTGVLVGLASHNPAVIDSVEGRNWDVDFFMCSVYRYNRTPEELSQVLGGEMTVGETYLEKDPVRMYRVIRQSKKTCFAFKILAAGRIQSSKEIDQTFRFAYDSIKPRDGVIVGMYPRFSDQASENAERARRTLAGLRAHS